MIFSEQLRRQRMLQGLTQEALSEICNVSRQAVAKWEAGSSVPSFETVIRLSKLFHMSVDELLQGKESEYVKMQHDSRKRIEESLNEKLVNDALRTAMCEKDHEKRIFAFLRFLGENLHGQRVYIFERDGRGRLNNTYEWCAPGIIPQQKRLLNIPFSDIGSWKNSFKNDESVFIYNLEEIRESDPDVYRWLKPQKIRTLIACPLFEGEAFYGIDNPPAIYMSITENLLKIVGHFIESMIQERDLFYSLKLENEKNRHLNSVNSTVTYTLDLATRTIEFDDSFRKVFGVEPRIRTLEEIEGFLLEHSDCGKNILNRALDRIRSTRQCVSFDISYNSSSGRKKLITNSLCPLYDDEGRLKIVYGTLKDNTEKDVISDQHKKLLSYVPGAICRIALKEPFNCDYVSEGLYSLLGYQKWRRQGSWTRELLLNSILPSDQKRFCSFLENSSRSTSTDSICLTARRVDGTEMEVLVSLRTAPDVDGIMQGYLNIVDISKHTHIRRDS
ncbi:MAG: helix-turn-helix transcriptional regulator [Spirochaetales bacterium]|nr:helix-turn-helix transcriptional regulator [Spirochaetales bacterium]